ncbi:hypothetical protein BCR39DRAFT_601105 [Naematelia encephala]|uniref:Uncharacterized protein n=1 Tax=Naematelia encephala TaxID=71784 RepID=A0A1Y2AIU0_9TREE|nr:hypothetical protein BCR39DRAFT_601105 [Naematelia encephala]
MEWYRSSPWAAGLKSRIIAAQSQRSRTNTERHKYVQQQKITPRCSVNSENASALQLVPILTKVSWNEEMSIVSRWRRVWKTPKKTSITLTFRLEARTIQDPFKSMGRAFQREPKLDRPLPDDTDAAELERVLSDAIPQLSDSRRYTETIGTTEVGEDQKCTWASIPGDPTDVTDNISRDLIIHLNVPRKHDGSLKGL